MEQKEPTKINNIMKTQKYLIISIAVIFILIVIMTVYYYTNMLKKPCPPPQRVENIPTTTFWVGGCDGGLWYEQIENNDSIYKFKIYNDFNGKIISEGNFRINGNCFRLLKGKEIRDLISHSTNDRIYLTLSDEGKYCYLEKVSN